MTRHMDIVKGDYDFQFTRNWFRNRNLPTFREHVFPVWGEKPNIIYLELGVFEAQSLVWMMQHVITHPLSFAVGVDPHLMTTKLTNRQMEEVRKRAMHNILPWAGRCDLIRGNSAEVLRKMIKGRHGFAGIKKGSVDICMIDGNHNALAVIDDARLCFRLLKPGGWMMFDDVENDLPKKDHVKEGVQFFKKEVGDSISLVCKHHYMEIYKKVSS